ncbi:CRISPR-associated protein Cas4 [Bacteroidia bacterium]|nr:CRISPR-associated protein Cas4 [Bacteroidia bacterium]
MHINATLINLYNVCKREMWLHANGIRFEHTSDTVYEGKLIHETSYPQRPERYEELEIDGCKIDFYDARNKIVHEIKKSDKIEEAHQWQVKYYIYVLEQNGIEGVKGLLEYPSLRHTGEVLLTDEDRTKILEMGEDILRIIEDENCPEVINNKICSPCSYYEFCYVGESEL